MGSRSNRLSRFSEKSNRKESGGLKRNESPRDLQPPNPSHIRDAGETERRRGAGGSSGGGDGDGDGEAEAGGVESIRHRRRAGSFRRGASPANAAAAAASGFLFLVTRPQGDRRLRMTNDVFTSSSERITPYCLLGSFSYFDCGVAIWTLEIPCYGSGTAKYTNPTSWGSLFRKAI